MPARDSIDLAINALAKELTLRSIPAQAYTLQPIIFSGNFTARHGIRNAPQLGFRISCCDSAYQGAISELFAPLVKHSRLKPLEDANPAVIGLVGRTEAEVIEALNALILSKECAINRPDPSCSRC